MSVRLPELSYNILIKSCYFLLLYIHKLISNRFCAIPSSLLLFLLVLCNVCYCIIDLSVSVNGGITLLFFFYLDCFPSLFHSCVLSEHQSEGHFSDFTITSMTSCYKRRFCWSSNAFCQQLGLWLIGFSLGFG